MNERVTHTYRTGKGTEYTVFLHKTPYKKRHRHWWGIYDGTGFLPLAAGHTRFRSSAVSKIAKNLLALEWEEIRNDRKKNR